MLRSAMAAVIVALITTAGSTTAQQHPQTRQGFWIGFGLGAGSAGASCTGCSSEREFGLSGYFRAGGTVTPNLLIGGETNGWYKSESALTQHVGVLTGVVYFYPMPTSGLYLKGGAGLMTYRADDDVDELTATGLGVQFGLGYDFRLGGNFSLTPFGNFLVAFGADAKFDGISLGENLNPNVFQFGLGLNWH